MISLYWEREINAQNGSACERPKSGEKGGDHMDDIQELRPYMADYLQRLGVDTTKAKRGNTICPVCGGGRNTGCFHLYDGNGKVNCFSCGFNGDIVDLYKAINGVDTTEAIKALKREYNIADGKSNMINSSAITTKKTATAKATSADLKEEKPVKTYLESYDEWHNNLQSAEYQKVRYWEDERGLNDNTIEKFNLGYDIASGRAIIPVSPSYYKARLIGDKDNRGNNVKYMNPGGVQVEFLNIAFLMQKERPVFIVEGEVDAISICQAGGLAVALSSADNAVKFVERAKDYLQDIEYPLIIAFDNDGESKTAEAVEKHSREMQAKLHGYGVPFIVDNSFFIGCKDANEALKKDYFIFAAEVQRVEETAKGVYEAARRQALEDYQKRAQIVHRIDSLFEYQQGECSKPLPTGFDTLDSLLDGGLYPGGMYSIGAGTGAGKTAFVLQVADYMAKCGRDVLYISLELPDVEIISRSCSRLSYENAQNVNQASISRAFMRGQYVNAEAEETAYTTIAGYSANIAPHFYIAAPDDIRDFHRDTIKSIVCEHKRITGVAPVVFVDYVQILQGAPGEERLSDKQKTDRDIIALKTLAKQLKTPVVVVSSINRTNYGDDKEQGLDSFKESGIIEYTSDVAIILQKTKEKDSEDGKPITELEQAREKHIPKKINVKILKNRYGSRGVVRMFFMPMFGYYTTSEIYDRPTAYKLSQDEKTLRCIALDPTEEQPKKDKKPQPKQRQQGFAL